MTEVPSYGWPSFAEAMEGRHAIFLIFVCLLPALSMAHVLRLHSPKHRSAV